MHFQIPCIILKPQQHGSEVTIQLQACLLRNVNFWECLLTFLPSGRRPTEYAKVHELDFGIGMLRIDGIQQT